MDALQDENATLRVENTELRDRIDRLEPRMERLQQTQARLASKIKDDRSVIRTQQIRITHLEGNVASDGDRIRELEAELRVARGRIWELEGPNRVQAPGDDLPRTSEMFRVASEEGLKPLAF